jgi:anti-anti-sigma factor
LDRTFSPVRQSADLTGVELIEAELHTPLGSFRRDDRSGRPRLVADGDIDDRVVEALTDAIFELVCDAHDTAVVDLTRVTYFGSNGIGALITGKAVAHDHGVDLVVEPSRIVRRVLYLVGLTDFFAIDHAYA